MSLIKNSLDSKKVEQALLNGYPAIQLISQIKGSLVSSDSDFEILDDIFMSDKKAFSHTLNLIADSKRVNYIANTVATNYTISSLSEPDESRRHATPHNLRWSRTKEVSIFYDRTLVGFYTDSTDLTCLGWGSKKYGSYLAQKSCSSAFVGSAIICITRHASGYAHFLRDLVAKVCWYDKNIRPITELDTLITDNKLSIDELNFLRSIGLRAQVISASLQKPVQKYIGDIVVFEIGNGSLMLKELRDQITDEMSCKPKNAIFLMRGDNSRRNFPDESEFVRELGRRGIDAVNTQGLCYLDQLRIASEYEHVISLHGAQLINSILSNTIIEIMPFPYALSPWSLTILKQANALGISRKEILVKQTRHDFQHYSTRSMIQKGLLSLPESQYWQKQNSQYIENLDNTVDFIVSHIPA